MASHMKTDVVDKARSARTSKARAAPAAARVLASGSLTCYILTLSRPACSPAAHMLYFNNLATTPGFCRFKLLSESRRTRRGSPQKKEILVTTDSNAFSIIYHFIRSILHFRRYRKLSVVECFQVPAKTPHREHAARSQRQHQGRQLAPSQRVSYRTPKIEFLNIERNKHHAP